MLSTSSFTYIEAMSGLAIVEAPRGGQCDPLVQDCTIFHPLPKITDPFTPPIADRVDVGNF
jgi:hypothetical protein